METRGELRIDPGSLVTDAAVGELEIVVPYSEWSVTGAVLERAASMTAGLNARVTLLAVQAIPFPAQFECPASVHAHLVEQLADLASHCPLPVNPLVVLARARDEGYRYYLKPESTVLVGTRKHWWRTSEERLARTLVKDGHKVVLLHVA